MTIYEALKQKLGREPTNAEIKADVRRILDEALAESASKGKLKHQRKRYSRKVSLEDMYPNLNV